MLLCVSCKLWCALSALHGDTALLQSPTTSLQCVDSGLYQAATQLNAMTASLTSHTVFQLQHSVSVSSSALPCMHERAPIEVVLQVQLRLSSYNKLHYLSEQVYMHNKSVLPVVPVQLKHALLCISFHSCTVKASTLSLRCMLTAKLHVCV